MNTVAASSLGRNTSLAGISSGWIDRWNIGPDFGIYCVWVERASGNCGRPAWAWRPPRRTWRLHSGDFSPFLYCHVGGICFLSGEPEAGVHDSTCGDLRIIFWNWVFLVMNLIVLPLSAIHFKGPYTLRGLIQGLLIHMICIGLPISFSVRQFSK